MGESRRDPNCIKTNSDGYDYLSRGGNNKYLAEELVKADKEGKVVYCRFGKQYIFNLEK